MRFDGIPLLLTLALLGLLAAALAWRFRERLRRRTPRGPADALDTLSGWTPQATRVMTVQERIAYITLRQALPRHMVLAQVPLARFIRVPERNSYAEWMRRVGQLCADLVICDRNSQVIAVVEVYTAESRSERSDKRQRRIARVLDAANIPLHVWIEGRLPTAERAREALLPRLPAAPRASVVPPPPVMGSPRSSSPFASPYASPVGAVPNAHSPVPYPPAPLPAAPFGPAVSAPMGASQPATDLPPFAYNFDIPADDDERPTEPLDDDAELREPPPSTWLDDFDSSPVPLAPLRSGRGYQ